MENGRVDMGRVKEAYHEEIIAEQEQTDREMEELYVHQLVVEAAELCAKDDALYSLFVKTLCNAS